MGGDYRPTHPSPSIKVSLPLPLCQCPTFRAEWGNRQTGGGWGWGQKEARAWRGAWAPVCPGNPGNCLSFGEL